jgi:TusA-related sulfurtransferase
VSLRERRYIMGVEKVDRCLDLRGKVCPYPTLEPRLALNEMPAGEVLEVITDYYPARQTIPQLMQDLGYTYELVDGDKPVFRFLIWKT